MGVTPSLANTIAVLNVNDGIVPDAKTGFLYISRCVIVNVTASPMVNLLKSLNQFPMQFITLIGPEKEKPPSAPKFQNSQGRRRWVTPIKSYPVLLISHNAQIGNETGLQGQSRAQRQGDFNDNSHIRVIRKVRKTQHQNPQFGHTQVGIFKKLAKKYISIQGGMKLRKPSILVVNCVD